MPWHAHTAQSSVRVQQSRGTNNTTHSAKSRERTREWSGKIIIKYKKSSSSYEEEQRSCWGSIAATAKMLKISRESPWVESHRKWSAQSKVTECATSSVGQRNRTKISPYISSSLLSSVDHFFVICGDFMFSPPRMWSAMRPTTTRESLCVQLQQPFFLFRCAELCLVTIMKTHFMCSLQTGSGSAGSEVFTADFYIYFLLCTLPQPSLSFFHARFANA